MGPPTEQLIRDYLNRLSVAARDRLGPEDRRALVDRTRKLIERKADFAGRPTMLEVGRVLARLGDPAVLVDQECRRLAAIRGEVPDGGSQSAGTPQPLEPADSWELAELSEPGTSRGFLGRVLRREPGRAWRANSGWPTAVPSENAAPERGAAPPGPTPQRPEWPSVVAREGGTAPYPQSGLPVSNGTLVGGGMTPADPGGAEAGPAAAAVNGMNGAHIASANGTAAFDTESGEDFEPPAGFAVATGAGRLLGMLASAAWQQPLEATAIILLGVGGVIFPPVFLLGAIVALGSKVWHYRDKWAGLVLPPLLTVIAVAAAVAVGGRGHGLHDSWLALNIVSRLAALLGAGYLAWRAGPGRQPPPAPPWHKPDRTA